MKGPPSTGYPLWEPKLAEYKPPKNGTPCNLPLCLEFFTKISESSLFEGIRYSETKYTFVFDGGADSQGITGTAINLFATTWQWAISVKTRNNPVLLAGDLICVMKEAIRTLSANAQDLDTIAQTTLALLGEKGNGGLCLLIDRISKTISKEVADILQGMNLTFIQRVIACVAQYDRKEPVTIESLYNRVTTLTDNSIPSLERKIFIQLDRLSKTESNSQLDKILRQLITLTEQIMTYQKKLEIEGWSSFAQFRHKFFVSRLHNAMTSVNARNVMAVQKAIQVLRLQLEQSGTHPIDPIGFTEAEWDWYTTMQHYRTVQGVGTQEYLKHTGECAINQVLTKLNFMKAFNLIYDMDGKTPLFVHGGLPTRSNFHGSNTFVRELNTFLKSQGICHITAGLGAAEKFEVDDKGLLSCSVRPEEWRNEGVLYLHQPAATDLEGLRYRVAFLDFCIRNQKLAYVHCKSGRGRSTQAIILYLVQSRRCINLTKAMEHVQSCRKQAEIKGTDAKWPLAIEYCMKYVEDYNPELDMKIMSEADSRVLLTKLVKNYKYKPQ